MMSKARTPLARNTQTTSDSVQAVITAATVNSDHRSLSRARVMRVSLTALRTMMAMTAAPMP